MKKMLGIVKNVFIPEEYKNGVLLDIMDRHNIGFNVETLEGMKEVIVEQNEVNADIYKDDKVLIIEQYISGEYFVDIELFGGDVDV